MQGAGAVLRRPAPTCTELPGLDSNQDKEYQNLKERFRSFSAIHGIFCRKQLQFTGLGFTAG